MRMAMIGSGYVGLVSGACFADFGHQITCVDNDTKKIAQLKSGRVPIFEPGLDALVRANVDAGRLQFTTDLLEAVGRAEAVFIAVGTPSRRGDGHADLKYVFQVARELAPLLDGYTVVVTKSTVPVGTADAIEAILAAERPDAAVDVVSNPEFLREGSAIEDFKRPDRVVVGSDSERARSLLAAIYRPLYLNRTPIVFTGRRTAELIKYAGNAFLATKISFINELATLCEAVDADVQDLALGIGLDGRIGPKFLHPGPGYGGSCFPKDTMALIRIGEEAGAPLRIVETVSQVNSARKRAMVEKIVAACGGEVQGLTLAVLGVTFKQATDDVREAPSLDIIPALLARGARVRAYDPKGAGEAAKLLPGVDWARHPFAAIAGADALIILTEWDMFRALSLTRVKSSLRTPLVIDLRNIYTCAEMSQAGLEYHSIGRVPVPASAARPVAHRMHLRR